MKRCLIVAVFFLLQSVLLAQSLPLQVLSEHVPAVVARLTPVGRLEAERQMKLAIALPLRDREGLTNLLQRLYDPASPDYRQYLSPARFAERFGPRREDYEAVAAFAAAHGLTVTATHANRTLLDVTGSVANIEKAFHLNLRTYSHPHENRIFYAPDAEPALDLATPVMHISGLDNYLLPHPMSLRQTPQFGVNAEVSSTGSGPGGAFMGHDFRAAYLPNVDLTGAGQSVGVLEFDGYYPSDISTYETLAWLPAVTLTNVYVDGVSGTPGKNNLEVALDIEMAVAMAPGLSSVIIYEGVEGGNTDDVLNRMATDDLANQLSASWTYPIDTETEQILQQMAAQGQSFFNSSGDGDAWIAQISTPCDNPNLTSVGGTTLTTSGPGGAYVSETVWNWENEYGVDFNGQGSGGGLSSTYTIPSWQL